LKSSNSFAFAQQLTIFNVTGRMIWKESSYFYNNKTKY
jgi:hypothetical protein